ncbi:unnamed protein product [Parascedosporium putredinis]|uniref:ENTH domain-containing protein n=1 Tax=Parascedosporium putredinis TaxID=1442378 RepID=A0A9P1H3U6_9PEZI|nr:unnamed protein product [Parascedosporium putredinis]CAI7996037.1 unnamed protein product [Parascedosporium putredinis]
MAGIMRSVKNVTKGYSSVQVKVREATSNDSWGPTGTQMSEIAQLTFNLGSDFVDIMDMLDKRLNDKGKNWRHVLKALKVLDYCLHEGAERVVTWARQNIYIIKTLREFQYVDEEGRDVGQNVRVAAKELTSLIMDEERLRAERTDRRSWKSRVTGLEEYGPPGASGSSHGGPRERPRQRGGDDDDDLEYKLAIEASKAQEEEDKRKRQSKQNVDSDDDDLAKAIKLSKEEEDRRRKELEQSNATSLFDDDLIQVTPSQPQVQYTGLNQGYMQNAYTGFQTQPTGFAGNYSNGYGMQNNMLGADPYGQQQQQQQQQQQMQQMQSFQPQPTGYNPYAQQQVQSPAQQDSSLQPGSNNPWASNGNQQQSLAPTPTGSNNPFANSFNRQQSTRTPVSTLGSLPEQKSLSSFNSQPFGQPSPQPVQQQQQQNFQQPQRELTEHESKLNSLLATGDGMDTFGNTGNLRIPAQHTAPGPFCHGRAKTTRIKISFNFKRD